MVLVELLGALACNWLGQFVYIYLPDDGQMRDFESSGKISTTIRVFCPL